MNKIISPLRQDMQGSAVVDLQDALRACLDRGALLAQDSALRDQMLAALSPEPVGWGEARTPTSMFEKWRKPLGFLRHPNLQGCEKCDISERA
jgi:hypothetical protein